MVLLLIQHTIALAQTAATIQDITWALGTNYPTPIKGGAAGIVDNTLVYAGGEHIPDSPTHDSNLTYGFPLGGTAWTSLPNMPKSLVYFDAQAVGNAFYVTGGRSNFQTQGTTYSLSQNNGVWQWSTLPALNVSRGYFGMGATQGQLLVEGGMQGNGQPPYTVNSTINAPELFNTNDPQAGWQSLPAMPGLTRALPTVAGVDGNFYVFGGTIYGYMGSDSTRLSDAYEYHTTTHQWTQLPDTPFGLSGATSVVYGDRYIIMLGGVAQDVPNQPNYYNNHVEVFDTLKGTYSVMSSLMSYGTNNLGAAIIGNTIYAVGGESQIAADSNTEPWLQIGQIVATLPGDVNHDSVVNGLDISAVASHWLSVGTPGTVPGDVNVDGMVNGLDIDLIASQWLQTTGAGTASGLTVPEPATFAMLGVALAFFAMRQWHGGRVSGGQRRDMQNSRGFHDLP
jgi:hypothetical protein